MEPAGDRLDDREQQYARDDDEHGAMEPTGTGRTTRAQMFNGVTLSCPQWSRP
jgi:hypothetical protein